MFTINNPTHAGKPNSVKVELLTQPSTVNLLQHGVPIKKHVKGGGLLYGGLLEHGVPIEKNMLMGEVYYLVVC